MSPVNSRIKNRIKECDQIAMLPRLLKWLAIALVVAVMAGVASAGFLASLEWATAFRESHVLLIALLPAAGLFVGWLYLKFGKSVEAGNNLLIDEVHDPQKTVPLRMTPLVLFGTVMSHLFGASVGREGTAIQMGGSLADQLTKPLKLSPEDRRILLMTGMSAGFSSVFGIPLAGAVFGFEVLSIGKLRYDAIFPCFVAAILANRITLSLGIHHQQNIVPFIPQLGLKGLFAAILAGAAFGLVGMLFARVTHFFARIFKGKVKYGPLRPLIGGAILGLAALMLGSTEYLGLGLPTIAKSFTGHVVPWAFAMKLLFTTFSLGAGFKGGEVTPLFFIGASLGNALAWILPLPAPLLAGMGLAAVFAGAANTPLACTIMAMELFGPQIGVYAGIACVVSYMFSGHASIYHSQRVGLSKTNSLLPEGLSLSAFEEVKKWPDLNLIQDIHRLGFLNRKENTMKKGIACLRFYFHHGAKVKAEGFWKKLRAPSVGAHLAAQAKKEGLQQVIVHRVTAGYLNGDPVSMDIGELPPQKLPQCVELVDHEDKLRTFVTKHGHWLEGVRTILLRCESEPLFDFINERGEESAEPSLV